MTTEQQEFLDYLKNPTKARLKQAVNEFYENHRNSLYSVFAYEHHKGTYIIEVKAGNHGILYATEKMLASTIAKYLKRPVINIRSHPKEKDGLFTRTYYVTEA